MTQRPVISLRSTMPAFGALPDAGVWRIRMKGIAKHIAAVLVGLLLIDGFCAWYYNTAPYEHDEGRATDTVRRPGALVSQAKEGMGVHRIDGNGYNNPKGDGEIGVLLMGSSHTEGFNVAEGRDVTSRLGRLLGCRAYNLGMSAHVFYRNAANLGRALDRFQPTEAVVLETDRVVFMRGQIEKAMSDALPRLPDTRIPLPDVIVNRPLSKRLYKQFLNLTQEDDEDEAPVDYDDISPALFREYEDTLTAWLAALNGVAAARGVRLVIWFHPHLSPDMDGTAATQTPERCLQAFARACERADVTFVDMTEPFLEAYRGAHTLPHGFANTCLGGGHLNEEGHRLAAEALYRAIRGGGAAS